MKFECGSRFYVKNKHFFAMEVPMGWKVQLSLDTPEINLHVNLQMDKLDMTCTKSWMGSSTTRIGFTQYQDQV